jgi:hypothetical protein
MPIATIKSGKFASKNMFSSGLLLGLLPIVVGQHELLYEPEKYPDIPEYGPQVNQRRCILFYTLLRRMADIGF